MPGSGPAPPGSTRRIDGAGRVADSRSRRSTSASLASQSRSNVRPTRRFSGSTARNRRRANSASYRARSTINSHWRSTLRACSAIWSMAAIDTSSCAGCMASRKTRATAASMPVAAERLASLLSEILMKLIAFVQGNLAVVHVTDRHPPPTPPAQDEALQQRRPFADRPALLLMIACAIVKEPLLVPLELLPGDVAGMVVVEDERPLLGDDAARPSFDPGLLAGQDDVAGLGPSIDIGACVRRIVEDGQDSPVVQGSPGQLAVAAPPVMAGREAEMVLGEILDHPERGPHPLEGVEDQAQRLLHLLVGIEDDLAGGVVDQPGGQPEAELAGPGLLQLAPQQPRAEPVQLGFAHGALDPQEQAVVVLSGIINAILVDDEGIGQATDLDEAIPVAAGTRQARRFQAEDGAGTAESDLGHQVLEAVATDGGGPGVTLVLVDDLDVFLGPSELVGALRQVVLAGGAGDVVAHLHGGRLPDIDQGLAVEMLGADLGGAESWRHGVNSLWVESGRWVTRLEARFAMSRMALA